MGARDYYKKGDWNAICYVCGFKRKASEMKLRWDGVYVCAQDWEPRQPQDFVRGVPDGQPVDWTQPEPPDTFNGPVHPPLTNIVVGVPTIYVNGAVQTLGPNYSILLPQGVITFTSTLPSGSLIAWSGVWLDNANNQVTYTKYPLYTVGVPGTVFQIYGVSE